MSLQVRLASVTVMVLSSQVDPLVCLIECECVGRIRSDTRPDKDIFHIAVFWSLADLAVPGA